MKYSAAINHHDIDVLACLFTELEHDALQKIMEAGEKRSIEPGSYLFRQGDVENSLYIVLRGRLRAVKEDANGLQNLGDIGEGEPTGEFALFTNEPRMASVLAIRKTTVLGINKQEYLKLVAKNPAFAGMLTSFLIKRSARGTLRICV